MDEMDEMHEMDEMNERDENKTKMGELTTDNPLSNRGAMAICCRVLLSAVLKYQGQLLVCVLVQRC